MKPVYIEAFNIPGAWSKIVEAIMDKGVNQKLQAYDEYAKTLYNLLVYIDHPEIRPLSCAAAGYSEKMVYDYFSSFFFAAKETDHEHNYGDRLRNPIDQFQLVADMLKIYPYTRRAIMVIPKPEDLTNQYAPCVRELNFYTCPPDHDILHTTIFMRSWDTYSAGIPDLASFQLAAELVGKMIPMDNGTLTVLATNAHIYKKSVEFICQERSKRKQTFLGKMRKIQREK